MADIKRYIGKDMTQVYGVTGMETYVRACDYYALERQLAEAKDGWDSCITKFRQAAESYKSAEGTVQHPKEEQV